MQTTIKFADGKSYNTSTATVGRGVLKGYSRETLTVTAEMDYSEAATHFVDGAAFTLTDEYGESYEWLDYGVAGAITDNRDGTITAVMGKNNTAEQDAQEKAEKASQDTVVLAGRPVKDSDDVSALGKTFEAAAAKLSDSDAAIAPSLSQAWNLGQQVAQGERRYYAPNNTLYKCLVSHKTDLTNGPDMSGEYWSKL